MLFKSFLFVAVLFTFATCALSQDSGSEEELTTDDQSRDLSVFSREEKIYQLTNQIAELREFELAPAFQRYAAEVERDRAFQKSQPWFPSASEKDAAAASTARVDEAKRALEVVVSKETALVKARKPLYGIVSREFMDEQRLSMGSSLREVNRMAKEQVFYGAFFDGGRAESLSELIVMLVMRYVMTYLLCYPFAVGYYAFFVLPTSLYEYSSGTTDVFTAAVAYVLLVALMLTPIACLVGGVWYFRVRHRERWEGIFRR